MKVVTVHTICSLVNQLTGSCQRYWTTKIWLALKELPVQRRNGDEDFFNVALACEDGNWSWAHKTVLSGGSTFIKFELHFIMLQYHPLALLCIIYSEQQLESGCSIVYNGPDIIGDEDENLAEGNAGGKPWVIIIDQWSGASERLVSWWILEWSSDAWCLMCSWNVNIANLKRVCWWPAELSSVWCAWCYHGMGILRTQS